MRVIEDARYFGTYSAYPTIEEVEEFNRSKGYNAQITVEDDSIGVVLPEHV
ncbi:MAG: hypothetical protein WBG50_27715 [Desulfomonilaceae bacterium]